MGKEKNEKWCPQCEARLGIKSFGVNRSHDDGLQTWCKGCISKYYKLKAEQNKEKWANRDPYDGAE